MTVYETAHNKSHVHDSPVIPGPNATKDTLSEGLETSRLGV